MAASVQEVLLVFAALLLAGIGGTCVGMGFLRRHELAARKRRAQAAAGASFGGVALSLPADRIVRYLLDTTHRLSLGVMSPLFGWVRVTRVRNWLACHAKKAGLEGVVTAQGFVETSGRLALAMGVAALLGGMVFSAELGVVGGVLGSAWGITAPARAVKRAKRTRAEGLGRSLSEMLEVVSLGLRSGLSFDRSFELYGTHFDSALARDCSAAQRSWTFGLATREDALRDLASSYDAPLLSRVVESVIRSLRFGSSVSESLEAAAADARVDHRTRVEERVAKAPVKMMMPTGALILPAMLLLVLGPVLLELMEGF